MRNNVDENSRRQSVHSIFSWWMVHLSYLYASCFVSSWNNSITCAHVSVAYSILIARHLSCTGVILVVLCCTRMWPLVAVIRIPVVFMSCAQKFDGLVDIDSSSPFSQLGSVWLFATYVADEAIGSGSNSNSPKYSSSWELNWEMEISLSEFWKTEIFPDKTSFTFPFAHWYRIILFKIQNDYECIELVSCLSQTANP